MIGNETGFARHVDCIHYNPVKHGYKKNAVDWQYSTIHQHLEQGLLDENWGNAYRESDQEIFGEHVCWAVA